MTWRVACRDVTRSVRDALDDARRQPEVRVVRASASSGGADSLGAEVSSVAVAALRKLGCDASEARGRVAKARERLEASGSNAGVIDASTLVRAACRGG